MTTETLDLTPGPVLERAADLIEQRGLAREDYVNPRDGVDPDLWPLDPLAAIAVAAGLDPHVWEEDLDHNQIAPAVMAVDVLAISVGLDPDGAYDETVGAWSDDRTAEQVVAALRDAAQVVQKGGAS